MTHESRSWTEVPTYLSRLLSLSWCLGSLATTASCNKLPNPACIAGASMACACPDSRKGAQSCNADGTGFGPCVCSGAAAPAASASTPPVAMPVAAPTPVVAPPLVAFVTTLGPLDHYSGKGVELTTLAAIIRQDRYRVHSGRADLGDEVEGVYSDDKARVELEKLLAASLPADEVSRAVLGRNPKVKVSVFTDHAKVELVAEGTDEVACVVSTNRVAGVSFPFDGSKFLIPAGMAARGWKVVSSAEMTRLLEPSGIVAVEFGPGSAEMKTPTCMTTHGVHIGSTLADARKDTDFAAKGCTCESDPSGGANRALVVSKVRNDGVIYLRAKCRGAVKCPGEGEDQKCSGDWGREDCIIESFSVGPPAGGM